MKFQTDSSMSSICRFVEAKIPKLVQFHLFKFAFPLFIFSQGCTAPSPNPLYPSGSHVTTSENLVPFKYLDNGIIVVPVKINDSVTKDFILYTGIGITMISKETCELLKCSSTGTHTGKRMSGQTMTVPMSFVKSLSLGSLRISEVPVCVTTLFEGLMITLIAGEAV